VVIAGVLQLDLARKRVAVPRLCLDAWALVKGPYFGKASDYSAFGDRFA
jgi:hypothetical protein